MSPATASTVSACRRRASTTALLHSQAERTKRSPFQRRRLRSTTALLLWSAYLVLLIALPADLLRKESTTSQSCRGMADRP